MLQGSRLYISGIAQIAIVMVIDCNADLYDRTNGIWAAGCHFLISSCSWRLHKNKHITCYKVETLAVSKSVQTQSLWSLYGVEAELVPNCLQLQRTLDNRTWSLPTAQALCLNACVFHHHCSTEAALCCRGDLYVWYFKKKNLKKRWSSVVALSSLQCTLS